MIKAMLAQVGGVNFSKFKVVWWIGRNSKKIQKKLKLFDDFVIILMIKKIISSYIYTI